MPAFKHDINRGWEPTVDSLLCLSGHRMLFCRHWRSLAIDLDMFRCCVPNGFKVGLLNYELLRHILHFFCLCLHSKFEPIFFRHRFLGTPYREETLSRISELIVLLATR